MFNRSQSGPGGLSINTSSANTLGTNASSQPPAAGGLFGLNSSQPQQSGGLFGSSTGHSQSQQSGGLFGAATNTSQPQQTNSLFGSSTNKPQPQQGSGLFASSTTSSQPQATGGLFGATTSNQGGGLFGSQTMSKPQQTGGSLFGLPSNQPQSGGVFGSQPNQQQNAQSSQPQQSGGLFGTLGHSQNQSQNHLQQGSSLFGTSNVHNKPSIFGSTTTQNQPQQRPSFFSQTSSTIQPQQVPPQRTLFANSIGYNQHPQVAPGTLINLDQIRSTTRFNDLHGDLQKEIENIDNFILQQMSLKDQNQSAMPKFESRSLEVPSDVDYASKKLDTVQQALEDDAEVIQYAKSLVKKDTADARLSFKTIENIKLPNQFHHTGLWNVPSVSRSAGPEIPGEEGKNGESSDLISYFSEQAGKMTNILACYRQNMNDIEAHLKGLEASTIQQMHQLMLTRGRDGGLKSAEDQVRELAAVLREFENGIVMVAGRVGGAREKVQELKLIDDGLGRPKARNHGEY